MVTKDAAIQIAETFVRKNLGRSLRLYHATYISEASMSELARIAGMPDSAEKYRSHWAISFETTICGIDGSKSVVDGPTIVAVDAETGDASYSDSL